MSIKEETKLEEPLLHELSGGVAKDYCTNCKSDNPDVGYVEGGTREADAEEWCDCCFRSVVMTKSWDDEV